MKKILFIILITSLFVLGCSKSTSPDVNQLYGTWIVDVRDGKDMPTNDFFVMEFRSDSYQYYGEMRDSKWNFYTTTKYRLDGDVIFLERENVKLRLKIIYLDNEEIVFESVEYSEDGVPQDDYSRYLGYKVDVNYKSSILGMWEGGCVNPAGNYTLQRWKYNEDGTYSYFSKNNAGEWVEKTDNEGKYYLYGDLLVTTWVNDDLSGIIGPMCEIWECDIENGKMEWSAYRQNRGMVEFEMNKK